ncbi:MAG: hypothetical protein KAY65_01930 [Planctomycetes bacterium]|nr:hypothetical protein [Planctomycetota bacterium]
MKQLDSKEALKKKLRIDSLRQLNEDKVQRRFIQLAKSQKISPELLKEVLSTVPKLSSAFAAVVRSMADVGVSLEVTKQKRWEFLQTIAQSGNFTPDQILEALKIIAECDQRESIDWNKVFDKSLDVVKVVSVVALCVVVAGLSGKIPRRNN